MKKTISLIMAILMVLSLAACGANSETTPTEAVSQTQGAAATTEAANANPYEGQTLKVSAFSNAVTVTCWENVCKAFEDAYGVTVELVTDPKIADVVRPQIIAGNSPDVYIYSSPSNTLYQSMTKEKQLVDLTDIYDGPGYDDETILKDQILDGLLTSSSCDLYNDGHIYSAPFAFKSQGLVYNKALLEKYGWELPCTWDEFLALGEKAKAEGIALLTYQGIYPTYLDSLLMPALASAIGTEKLGELSRHGEGIITSEPAMEVLKNFAAIAENGYLLEGTVAMDHTQAQSEFMQGKALFITGGDFLPAEMASVEPCADFEWALTAPPALTKDQTRYGIPTATGMCIPSGAENVALAKEFIRFIYTDTVAEIFARDAAMLACTKDGMEIASAYVSEDFMAMHEIDDAFPIILFRWATVPEGSRIVLNDEVYNPISDVMNGAMSAEEWAQKIEAALHAINSGE